MNTAESYKPVDGPLKYFGGKHYLAPKIIGLMPPHLHYVEPFAGGLSVLLEKDPEGVSEVVNDIYGDLANFWKVLSDEKLFALFVRQAQATPFSERTWQYATHRRLGGMPCVVSGRASRACFGFLYFVPAIQSWAVQRLCNIEPQ